jgi:hypothetical protein
LPSSPGYSGFEVTTISAQIAMIIVIVLLLSLYAWTIAHLSRFVIAHLSRFVADDIIQRLRPQEE